MIEKLASQSSRTKVSMMVGRGDWLVITSADGILYALRLTHILEAIEAEIRDMSVRMLEKTGAKVLVEKNREFIEKGMS